MAKIFTPYHQQFLLFSIKERLLLKEFWLSRGQDFTIDKVSKAESKDQFDAIITSASTTYLVDIKVRNLTSTIYSSSKIAKSKYDYLVGACRAAAEEGVEMTPCYLIFYKNNKVAFFNLNDITPVWRERDGYSNSSTTTNNPIKTLIEYDIPLSQAVIYDGCYNREKDYNDLAIEVAEVMFPGNKFEYNKLSE